MASERFALDPQRQCSTRAIVCSPVLVSLSRETIDWPGHFWLAFFLSLFFSNSSPPP